MSLVCCSVLFFCDNPTGKSVGMLGRDVHFIAVTNLQCLTTKSLFDVFGIISNVAISIESQ